VKLSMTLPYAGNPRTAADQVKELESAGLDTVWVAEGYGFDSPTLMGYLAAKTSTVEIGSAILNIYSRSPSALAQTAAGLDNVSGGRALLGLGSSGPQVIEGWHGLPYAKPLARTRDVIAIVRSILRRETLQFSGEVFDVPLPSHSGRGLGKPLKLINQPERSAVPIFLAALGEKNVQLAAELADGWLPFLYSPERAADQWGAALAAGSASRSSDLGQLRIVAGGMVAIGDDVGDVLDRLRPTYALYIGGMGARSQNFYAQLVSRYGFEAEAATIQKLYLEGRKRDAEAAVPRALLEMCNLVGSATQVKERIVNFRDSGVTDLQVDPVTEDAPAVVAQLKEWLA